MNETRIGKVTARTALRAIDTALFGAAENVEGAEAHEAVRAVLAFGEDNPSGGAEDFAVRYCRESGIDDHEGAIAEVGVLLDARSDLREALARPDDTNRRQAEANALDRAYEAARDSLQSLGLHDLVRAIEEAAERPRGGASILAVLAPEHTATIAALDEYDRDVVEEFAGLAESE